MNHGDSWYPRYKSFYYDEMSSKHINILMHYDRDTLLDKSGKLIKIIKISGLDYFTKDVETLDAHKLRRNHMFKNISSEIAIYSWEMRRKINQFPLGEFPDGFSKKLNEKYRRKISLSPMFHGELYLAIITKPQAGLINYTYSILRQFSYSFDKFSKQRYLDERLKELNFVTQKYLNTFSRYNCQLLGVYEKNGVLFSDPMCVISKIINYDSIPVIFDVNDASKMLPNKRIFLNRAAGIIEYRSADDSRKFASILSIKAYSSMTYQGILEELSLLPCEYTMTQSFRFYDKQIAKTKLRDQQKDMQQSNDESIRLMEQIDDAFDDTASDDVGYGKHHLTLTCYADSITELNKHIGAIVAKFSDVGITCVREDTASELGFWAQLPGNFSYIVRSADISTKNVAGLMSFHNQPLGKIKGNHWGDAVTVFETISGSPYYFNFHYKDVGNFLVFGAMGSGKTVLVGFLIAQSLKFGGKRIIFDKDRGLEIMVRALNGTYISIKPGMPSGFNPCQLPDTTENRAFLFALLQKMLKPNNEHELVMIQKAIEGLYGLDVSARQLKHLAPFFGAPHRSAIRKSFDQWHSDGCHAWLFDNASDSLDLNADLMGFDLSHILADVHCKIPALMYLTYRVEKAIEGQRGILFCDEGWLYLLDDFFKHMINNWSRTPRKKNNIFGIATQVVQDTIDFKSINESAFSKIFFPNAAAQEDIYIKGFGLTEYEYHLIKTLPDDQHYFLFVHGQGENKQSVVLRFDLSGFEEEIAVISARETSLVIFDQVRTEVGDDPKNWLPLFQSRLRGSA